MIYGAVNSPLAQPRNLIGGHVLSALVGVTVFKFLPEIPFPPHTEEQHEEIESWNSKLQKLMEIERACSN